MNTDRMKGKLGRAWPLILIVAVAAAGVLAVKSSHTTGQPQTQTTTSGQEPMRVSTAEELSRVEPTETAERPQPGLESTGSQTASHVRVEVIHFHGTHQCYSCKMVGALAERTVQTYFKDELASGRITFAHINGQLAQNSELVRKYDARNSSLWIGTTIDGTFHKEQDLEVWRKIKNERDYLEYLKGLLERRLAGDLEKNVLGPPPVQRITWRTTGLEQDRDALRARPAA